MPEGPGAVPSSQISQGYVIKESLFLVCIRESKTNSTAAETKTETAAETKTETAAETTADTAAETSEVGWTLYDDLEVVSIHQDIPFQAS